MDERFSLAVDRHLPVGYRVVARAVRADRLDLVQAAAGLANGLRLDLDLHGLHRIDDGIRLDVAHAVRGPDGAPLRLERHDDGDLVWKPPSALIDGLALSSDDLVANVDGSTNELSLVLRLRWADLEYDRPKPIPMRTAESDLAEVAGRTTFDVDPATFAAGGRLPDGTWDVLVQAEFGGFRAHRRVPALPAAPALRAPTLRPYATRRGDLAVAVGTAGASSRYARRAVAQLEEALPRARTVVRRVLPPGMRRVARDWLRRLGA
jgi:hypothetical protein